MGTLRCHVAASKGMTRVENPKFLRTLESGVQCGFFLATLPPRKEWHRVENPKPPRTLWCAMQVFLLAALPSRKECREWKTHIFLVHCGTQCVFFVFLPRC